jgi:hypothetical protein
LKELREEIGTGGAVIRLSPPRRVDAFNLVEITMRQFRCATVLLSITLLTGCGDDESVPPMAQTSTEYVVVAGFEEPTTPSPDTLARGTARPLPASLAAAVPPDSMLRDAQGNVNFNQLGVLRIRRASVQRPHAIVIVIPGFSAGANSLRFLAEKVLAESSGDIEMWLIDRRENLLEDLFGMQRAEAAGEAEMAVRYYQDAGEVQGRRYVPIQAGDVLFMAEWGVDVLMRDVRAVVRRAQAERPGVPIYLGGHSFGAYLAPAYAAYDFDPGPGIDPGFADLSGLILLDGGPGAFPTRFDAPQLVDRRFLDGGPVALPPHILISGLTIGGLRKLRAPDLTQEVQYPFFQVTGLLSPTVLQQWELDAMRSQFAGAERSPTFMPPADNRFVFAQHFDNDFASIPALRAAVGFVPGGLAALIETPDLAGVNPGGHLYLPKDLSPALQTWQPFDQLTPAEFTSLDDLAEAFFSRPTNTWEWYFPSRLVHDALLASNLDTSALSAEVRTELTRFGAPALEITQNHRVALPILAVRGEFGIVHSTRPNATVQDHEAVLQPYFDSLATPPAEIQVHTLAGFYHLDIVLARNNPAAQMIVDFVEQHEARRLN